MTAFISKTDKPVVLPFVVIPAKGSDPYTCKPRSNMERRIRWSTKFGVDFVEFTGVKQEPKVDAGSDPLRDELEARRQEEVKFLQSLLDLSKARDRLSLIKARLAAIMGETSPGSEGSTLED